MNKFEYKFCISVSLLLFINPFCWTSLYSHDAMDQSGVLKHLVPGTIVEQHVKTCKLGPKKCGLCGVHKAWLLYQKPWLRAILADGQVKLGCSMCAQAGWDGPWASFQQASGIALKCHCLTRRNPKATSRRQKALLWKCWVPPLRKISKVVCKEWSKGSLRDKEGCLRTKKPGCGSHWRKQFAVGTVGCCRKLFACL